MTMASQLVKRESKGVSRRRCRTSFYHFEHVVMVRPPSYRVSTLALPNLPQRSICGITVAGCTRRRESLSWMVLAQRVVVPYDYLINIPPRQARYRNYSRISVVLSAKISFTGSGLHATFSPYVTTTTMARHACKEGPIALSEQV